MIQPTNQSPSSTDAVVLFCDLVGYSKLSTAQQERLFVGLTAQARQTCADLSGQGGHATLAPDQSLPGGFRGLPTGDGFALVIDTNVASEGHRGPL